MISCFPQQSLTCNQSALSDKGAPPQLGDLNAPTLIIGAQHLDLPVADQVQLVTALPILDQGVAVLQVAWARCCRCRAFPWQVPRPEATLFNVKAAVLHVLCRFKAAQQSGSQQGTWATVQTTAITHAAVLRHAPRQDQYLPSLLWM